MNSIVYNIDIVNPLKQFMNHRKVELLMPYYLDVPELVALVTKTTPSTPSTRGGGPSGDGTDIGDRSRNTPTRKRETNHHQDPRFKSNTPFALRIKDQKVTVGLNRAKEAGKTMPLSSNGQPRCFTWHWKGFCFSTCSREYDHNKDQPLPPDEKEELYEFTKHAFPDP